MNSEDMNKYFNTETATLNKYRVTAKTANIYIEDETGLQLSKVPGNVLTVKKKKKTIPVTGREGP
jgi:hypothetical protein